jgi:hypothetical protein
LPILIIFAGLEIGARAINSYLTSERAAIKNFIFVPGKIEPSKTGSLPVKPNVSVLWGNDEWSVAVNTNDYGLRESANTELADVKIAFFGDSFSFGQGIDDNEQYSDFFADSTKFWPRESIVNFSYVNGFQPEHYEFYLKANPELKPEVAFIGLYLGNDLYSDLNETFYDSNSNELEFLSRSVSETGQLINVPSSLRWPWSFGNSWSEFSKLTATVISISRFSNILYKPGTGIPNTPNSVDIERGKTDLVNNRAMQSIARMRDLIEKRGGELYVVVIPQSYYFGDFPSPHLNSELLSTQSEIIAGDNLRSQTLGTCALLNLKCLDTSPWLTAEDFFLRDGHWNPDGHRAVGEALAAQLAQSASNQ